MLDGRAVSRPPVIIMQRLLSTVSILLALSTVAARADRCDVVASAIATKVGLKTGKRTKVNIPLQPLNLDADDEYGAYLNCAEGPRGLSLHYALPRSAF